MARPGSTAEAITPGLEDIYLGVLAEGMTHSAAAEATGFTLNAWRHYRRINKAFEERVVDALETGTDVLEDEARRRAATGTEKGVWYKGERVGAEREYSDQLLMFILRARRPDKYRERYDVQQTNVTDLAQRMVEGRKRLNAERSGAPADDNPADGRDFLQ